MYGAAGVGTAADPGGGELRENSPIKTQQHSAAENVNHRVSVSSAGALTEKQQ